MRKLLAFILSLFTLTVVGCEKVEFVGQTIHDTIYLDPNQLFQYDDSLVHDKPQNIGVSNALIKAFMMANINWTPVGTIPSVYSSPYFQEETKKGIPYSLAQWSDGYVGLDVSLYTFLTAVENPLSVMYTENLRQTPYNGSDCAPYYGSVCSASVWYALGIPVPYYTYSLGKIYGLRKMDTLNYFDIELCDVLWNTGHVCMVFDIGRDSFDVIKTVSIFETTRADRLDCVIRKYLFDDFVARWESREMQLYRYTRLENNTMVFNEPFAIVNNNLVPLFIPNRDLCTNKGDKVSFYSGEDVIIDIFNDNFPQLELRKDQEQYALHNIVGQTDTLKNLPYGLYIARLKNGSSYSSPIEFEIVDANVTVELGAKVKIEYQSVNGIPEYVELCDERERPNNPHILTQSEIARGWVELANTDSYCKVHFRGRYGRVCPKKIQITNKY